MIFSNREHKIPAILYIPLLKGLIIQFTKLEEFNKHLMILKG